MSDNFVHNCSTIIDLGCSTGSLTRSIYKRHQHKDINIIGYDLEQGMIDKAISLSKKEGIEIDYQKANIDVEFPSNVDRIISLIQFNCFTKN